MGKARAVCCLLLTALLATNNAAIVDVKSKGAKGDGKTNDGPAIVNAWKAACAGAPPSSVLFPAGIYMAFPPIDLIGPCKGPIEIKATGATIKAPPDLAMFKTDCWIRFVNVDGLTMTGGTYDGQGQQTWKNNKCAKTGTCMLPANIKLSKIKNALVKDVTSSNAKFFHMFIVDSNNIRLDHLTIDAPGTSVNTDGIHIGRCNGINITNTHIKTGDDCISFGDGSKNVHVEKVTCGPGHGISIGSLGRYPNEVPVAGIWISNCTFTGTMHGVRIKTLPGGTPGTASDLHFHDIIMNNVGTPILIDQQYCPHGSCKKVPSKVKISNVSFRKIRGSSSSMVAMRLACSAELPCDNVEVADINLTNKGPGGHAISECSNVKPKVIGQVVPPACPAGSPGGPK